MMTLVLISGSVGSPSGCQSAAVLEPGKEHGILEIDVLHEISHELLNAAI